MKLRQVAAVSAVALLTACAAIDPQGDIVGVAPAAYSYSGPHGVPGLGLNAASMDAARQAGRAPGGNYNPYNWNWGCAVGGNCGTPPRVGVAVSPRAGVIDNSKHAAHQVSTAQCCNDENGSWY